jgi:hypothetical protein
MGATYAGAPSGLWIHALLGSYRLTRSRAFLDPTSMSNHLEFYRHNDSCQMIQLFISSLLLVTLIKGFLALPVIPVQRP